jgi:hypothetical protein
VRRQLVTDPQHPTIDLGDLFQVHEGRHLSNGLLAAGEGAVDCDGHVSVSDRLVTNDGHEGRKHEHDEADRHRCTNSGTGSTSSAAVPASRAMWNGSTARTRNVYSAKSVSTYTARGTATVSTVVVAPMCAS